MSPRQRWTLVAACVATFMLLIDITVVNVALPEIQRELSASFSDLQWVIDAYALTLAAFLLTAGSAADRIGRRKVFVFGLAVFTVASVACGLAHTPLALIVSRGVQGIGGAVLFATSLALLAEEFEGRQRGTAFGIWGATIGGAVAIGPLVGGVLTDGLGWEWIFLVNVPVGLAAIALTLARVPESSDPEARVDRRPRRDHLLHRPVLPDLRDRARQRRGLGKHADRVAVRRLGGAAGRLCRDRAARQGAHARPVAVPQARLRRRFDRRVRPELLDVLDVPLPHALPAGRARGRSARRRPLLPASLGDLVLRRPGRRPARRPVSDPPVLRRRADARRRRASPDARRGHRHRVDRADTGLRPRRHRGRHGQPLAGPDRGGRRAPGAQRHGLGDQQHLSPGGHRHRHRDARCGLPGPGGEPPLRPAGPRPGRPRRSPPVRPAAFRAPRRRSSPRSTRS